MGSCVRIRPLLQEPKLGQTKSNERWSPCVLLYLRASTSAMAMFLAPARRTQMSKIPTIGCVVATCNAARWYVSQGVNVCHGYVPDTSTASTDEQNTNHRVSGRYMQCGWRSNVVFAGRPPGRVLARIPYFNSRDVTIKNTNPKPLSLPLSPHRRGVRTC